MNTRKLMTTPLAVGLLLLSALSGRAAPNLTPYQPAGWSDRIVVSTTTGTSTDSPTLTTTDPLYLDWAVINDGDAACGGFYTALYVDGAFKSFWTVSVLNPNTSSTISDYSLGSLTAGTHTLTITNDWMGMIAESNETDNGYTKTIVVNPPSQPNLKPCQPAQWSDPIVVSSITGTTSNSPSLTPADTVYLDWAVINDGTAATGARFYTALYVDGSPRTSWYSDPPVGTNSYVSVTDYSLGSFAIGVHYLMLITDSTGTIMEGDEFDNTYSRTFEVSAPSQPNLAPYVPPGWSDKVVISTNSGSTTDSPSPNTADTLYASWAVRNAGTASVTNGFLTTLSVDGVLLNTWSNAPPLAASNYVTGTVFLIGSLGAGLHTVTLDTDTGSAVAESNEGDNSYIKLVAVVQAPPGVETLAATSVTDASAQLEELVNPYAGVGYAWCEYGTNTSYGSTTEQQSFGKATTNMQFTVSGLTPETTYHYRAVAYNGGGTNRGSDVAFTTLGPAIRIEPLTLTFSVSGQSFAAGSDEPSAGTNPPSIELPAAAAPADKLTDPAELASRFTAGSTVKVIANLNLPSGLPRRSDFTSAAAMRTLQARIVDAQREVLDAVAGGDVRLRLRFENVPGFSAEVTPAGLIALQAHPRVASIEPVYVLEAHLAQGIPLIHGLTFRSRDNGAGMAIAICDTGIDYHHPRLGGGGFPNSKVLGGYDFGDNDADPIPGGQAHGTCCAGIAAGELGTVGDYIGGVAFGAKLYALKISSGSATTADTDAMVGAWDWCVTHRNDNTDFPILVISTSFGGGRHTSACDEYVPSMTTAANNAVAAGITVLASSGNDGYCDSVAWPACISNVISVGAVYDADFGQYHPCVNSNSCAPKISSTGCGTGYYADDTTAADKVTSYSNMAEFMTLLAPGNRCYTTDITGSAGESSGDYDESFGGTSAACPYAAGVVACLQSAVRARTGSYLSPQDVRNLLISSGDNIADTKVAITKPRVNLERAIQSLPDFSQTFRIYNDGAGALTVSSIGPESSAPWIDFAPSGPFSVSGATYQDVSVVVDNAQAPAGRSVVRLLVNSSDADQTPYPGGVYVETIREDRPVLSGMTFSNGIFQFIVTGSAGSNCLVQASSNLVSWWPLCTNSIPVSGSLFIADPNMTNRSPRFYRAMMP